jgi:hypothetical protein
MKNAIISENKIPRTAGFCVSSCAFSRLFLFVPTPNTK